MESCCYSRFRKKNQDLQHNRDRFNNDLSDDLLKDSSCNFVSPYLLPRK